MEDDDIIQVEVSYARPDTQVIIPLKTGKGTTAEGAIRLSGILDDFPEIELGNSRVGVFSKIVKLDHELRSGDRVEIYRPLIADPKEVRKKRAAAGKKMRKNPQEAGKE